MKRVKTLVMTGYGINCEEEVANCFARAGSDARVVHLNHLIAHPELMSESDILAIPGGFSYGDHIACGKNFSNKIRFNLWHPLKEFINSGKPVIGICNGYQILVKLGVLPDLQGESSAEFTFTQNQVRPEAGDSRFEDRWVNLYANPRNDSLWLRGVTSMELPVRHGEGRLICPDADKVKVLVDRNQIALYYCHPDTKEGTLDYPANPNGSLLGAAALTNRQGNVLGIMPHPEAYSLKQHYPHFLGQDDPVLGEEFHSKGFFKPDEGVGMIFFYNAVNYAKDRKHD